MVAAVAVSLLLAVPASLEAKKKPKPEDLLAEPYQAWLEDVQFDKALILPEEGARRVQVVIAPDAGETVSFRILSHRLDDDRIDLLVIGMRLEKDIDANIKTLSEDLSYSSDDRALLAEFRAKAYDSDAIKAMRID